VSTRILEPGAQETGAMPVHFRPMRPADVKRVHEIDVLSFNMPWPERSYHFEVSENSHAVPWVAETGAGEVIGMIVTWVIIDEAHIATIAIHPEHRRAGIGRRLLARGLLAAWERGARTAFLEVRKSNAAAQAMYQQFGFAVSGVRPRYYQDNFEDALLMTLEQIDLQRLRAELG
jgi:ribosomal-protein-alanine N-acetyltransferase